MDKYTVKMFPQAYRDLDQIYEQIALNSNYDSSAMDIVDQIEKAILNAYRQRQWELNHWNCNQNS